MLDNINQLLLRNSDLLKAKSPLFINLPIDDFFLEYQILYPQAKLTSFNTNYQFHQQVVQLKLANMTTVFSAHYQSDVKHDLVIIQFPKSKAELTFTLAMLGESVCKECLILVVGENKSGIKSLAKLASKQLQHCEKVDAARHCLLFASNIIAAQETFILANWLKAYTFSINDIIDNNHKCYKICVG